MKLSSSKKLTWFNDAINVLGIKVNLHKKDAIFVNYIPLLETCNQFYNYGSTGIYVLWVKYA